MAALLMLVMAPALSGCAASSLSSLLPSSPFSSSQKVATTPPQMATIPAPAPATQTAPAQTASIATPATMTGCPKFKAWGAGKHITVYSPAQIGDPNAIFHQASIQKTARECTPTARGLSAKLGIAGRVLLGPKGNPSKIPLPLLIHLFDGKSQKVKTQKYKTVVKLLQGNNSGQFSIVKRFDFQLAPGTSPASYRIYVEFDKQAPGAN